MPDIHSNFTFFKVLIHFRSSRHTWQTKRDIVLINIISGSQWIEILSEKQRSHYRKSEITTISESDFAIANLSDSCEDIKQEENLSVISQLSAQATEHIRFRYGNIFRIGQQHQTFQNFHSTRWSEIHYSFIFVLHSMFVSFAKSIAAKVNFWYKITFLGDKPIEWYDKLSKCYLRKLQAAKFSLTISSCLKYI